MSGSGGGKPGDGRTPKWIGMKSTEFSMSQLTRADSDRVKRKMRKLARRLAESNTWQDKAKRTTFADMVDVWQEAYQLIRVAGLVPEYEKRAAQLKKARMS